MASGSQSAASLAPVRPSRRTGGATSAACQLGARRGLHRRCAGETSVDRIVKREVVWWMRCFTRDRSKARVQMPLTPR